MHPRQDYRVFLHLCRKFAQFIRIARVVGHFQYFVRLVAVRQYGDALFLFQLDDSVLQIAYHKITPKQPVFIPFLLEKRKGTEKKTKHF
ncbi:hypothetical protein SDC9_148104 [bioreactor metagenome]|uniref:Uncharacterized protein n=1 Tax=bioreactor metagenome TaxID=1076179 RepID=A0A645EHI0_9ZZZZ